MNTPGPFRPGFWRSPLIVAVCLGVLGAAVGITIAVQDRLAAPGAPTPGTVHLVPLIPGRPVEKPPADPPGSALARAEAIDIARGMANLRGRWLQGYRLAGGAVTIAGHAWLGQSQATLQGLTILTGSIAPGIPGGPADAEATRFLGSGVTGPGGLVRLVVPIAPGDAMLYLWLSSSLPIPAATLHLRVGSIGIASLATAGQGPNWCCIGPVDVHSDSGHLNLELGNLGRAVLCGLAVTAP